MSIYKTGGPLGPIDDKSIIVQRDEELETALNHLRHGQYIALQSPRQTGKTTFLYQMQVALRDEYIAAAYLYLEDLNEMEFYQSLCEDIAEQLDDVIEADNPYPISEIQSQTDFGKYLGWISKHTPTTQRLVLMLDEVGIVSDELSRRFFGGFRKIFTAVIRDRNTDYGRTYSKWSFVFSGALDMKTLAVSKSSPLYNSCEWLTLKDFSEAQSLKLVNQLSNLSNEARTAINKAVYTWTSGHPYLTQKVCMLIEESDEYLSQNIINAENLVERLVQLKIVERWRDDNNIFYLFRHIQDKEEYQQFLRDILEGKKRKMDSIAPDLESIGFIIQEGDTYIIRNRIYKEALKLYFSNPPSPKYHLFISYSHDDKEDIEKVILRLKASGFDVWIDEEQIGGGDPLREAMVKGIKNSAHIMICLSPSYLDKTWTTFESFVNQAMDPDNRKRRIIPVKVKCCEIPEEYRWLYCPNLTDQPNWETEFQKAIKNVQN